MACFLVAKREPGHPPGRVDPRATAIPHQDTRTLSARTLTASVAIQARVTRVPQVRDSLVRLSHRQTSRTTTVDRARRARVQVKIVAALHLARVLRATCPHIATLFGFKVMVRRRNTR